MLEPKRLAAPSVIHAVPRGANIVDDEPVSWFVLHDFCAESANGVANDFFEENDFCEANDFFDVNGF